MSRAEPARFRLEQNINLINLSSSAIPARAVISDILAGVL